MFPIMMNATELTVILPEDKITEEVRRMAETLPVTVNTKDGGSYFLTEVIAYCDENNVKITNVNSDSEPQWQYIKATGEPTGWGYDTAMDAFINAWGDSKKFEE